MSKGRARRITIYQDHSGEWRYTVQAGNFRVIGASEQGLKRRASVVARVAKLYPEAELVMAGERMDPGDW